jgi:hypothetical protein
VQSKNTCAQGKAAPRQSAQQAIENLLSTNVRPTLLAASKRYAEKVEITQRKAEINTVSPQFSSGAERHANEHRTIDPLLRATSML